MGKLRIGQLWFVCCTRLRIRDLSICSWVELISSTIQFTNEALWTFKVLQLITSFFQKFQKISEELPNEARFHCQLVYLRSWFLSIFFWFYTRRLSFSDAKKKTIFQCWFKVEKTQSSKVQSIGQKAFCSRMNEFSWNNGFIRTPGRS